MAEIAIRIDFGAQKNKVSHCFYCFPIYFPWGNGTRCHDLSFLNVELYPLPEDKHECISNVLFLKLNNSYMYLYYLLHLTYKVIDSEKNAAANLFVRSTEFALFLRGLEKYCFTQSFRKPRSANIHYKQILNNSIDIKF